MGVRGLLPLFLFGMAALGSVAVQADELQYLDHSELALARLYNDISEATDTIDLTYLTWDPCSSASKVLMKKLREKTRPKKTAENPAPKPVKVRMLIDSYFHRMELAPMSAYFAANGVDMRFFNPSSSPTGGNFRSHSKMTLIDKKVPGKSRLITGGRNMGDEYFGMSKNNFVDRDVAVTAQSSAEDKRGTIAQAENGFEKLWSNRMSKKVQPASPDQMGRIGQCTKWTSKDAALEKYLQENAKKLMAQESRVICDKVKFTIDSMAHAAVNQAPFDRENPSSSPAANQQVLDVKPTSTAVLQLISGADRSLTMENQYFIPDGSYLKPLLRQKRAGGKVKIDLYSNMFDGSDEMVTLWHTHYMQQEQGATQRNHMNFRIAGLLDQWHFTPNGATYSYHAKTFVADGKDSIVSSFNIDPRSMHINGESALVVRDCPAFAKKVETTTKLTGKVWTLEENLHLCQGGEQPAPPSLDPIRGLIQFITKDLQ